MKSCVLGLLAAMLVGAPASAQEIGGRYRIAGKNPDGTPYGGTAEIVVTSQNTCRIVWNTGGISRGICMRNGNAFTAAYSMGNAIGLIIYQMQPDGSMQGLWTVADKPGVGAEILTPLR